MISPFEFFATGAGIFIVSLMAAALVVVWDWRVALVILWLIQTGVSGLASRVYAVSLPWVMAEIVVMLLCVVILGMSAYQAPTARSWRQSGNWLFRLLSLILIFVVWRMSGIEAPIPGFSPNAVDFFVWLAICALLVLGLGDNPLFTGVGLLLWLVPVQLIVSVLLPYPILVAVIGSLQLLLSLACGYLVLVDRSPDNETEAVITDITFPVSISTRSGGLPSPEPSHRSHTGVLRPASSTESAIVAKDIR